jgi:pimeloyl-ACP methyl ester carboxylesterase
MAWWRTLNPFFDSFALRMSSSAAEFNDREREFAFYGHYPKQTSVYNMLLFGRNMIEQSFLARDQKSKMELSEAANVDVPIVLMSGRHDLAVTSADVAEVAKALGPVIVDSIEVNGGHAFLTYQHNTDEWAKWLVGQIKKH